MKWNATTAIVFLALGIGLTVGQLRLSQIGGPRYDPSRAIDLIELRRLIYSLSPAVESLRLMRESGEALPENLDSVVGLPDHFDATFPLLAYVRAGNSFSLYYKVGWDSSLRYDDLDRAWRYDSGDGSPETQIAP